MKDTKSSNGTYLNGARLSLEGEESQPAALRTGDTIARILFPVFKDILSHYVSPRSSVSTSSETTASPSCTTVSRLA